LLPSFFYARSKEQPMTTNWHHHIPVELKDRLGSAAWEADDWGNSGTAIYHIGQHYLKIAPYKVIPYQEHSMLEAEKLRLQWLSGHLPVPEVHYYGHNQQFEFLLLSELDGVVACDQSFGNNIPEVVRLLAQGLHMIHNVDITHCPFDLSIEPQLELAQQYVTHHIIDKTIFNPEFRGLEAQEVYDLAIKLRPGDEDVVFTHGDYCLPNILLDRQPSRINGFIDWGHGGMADRYKDLALAARSLARNFGKQWVPLLFEEYGRPTPDQEKLKFYRAMDEITFYMVPDREH
jgi:aminoglycoside 3'-phosphotransferase II